VKKVVENLGTYPGQFKVTGRTGEGKETVAFFHGITPTLFDGFSTKR